MYILTNMVKNLWRNRGRNLLFAGIVFAVIAICTTGVLIRNASTGLISNYKKELSIKTTIVPDISKMSKGGGIEKTQLTSEQVKSFGDSKLLTSASYQARLNVELKDIKAVGADKANEMMGENQGMQNTSDFRMPTGTVIGSNNSNISNDFKEGKRKIIKGNMYKKANECIISEQLAEANNLSVGDKLKIDRPKGKSSPEELTISGIYSDTTMEGNTSSIPGLTLTDRNNEVLVSEDTATNLKMFSTAGTLEAEYYLKNPDLIEDFRAEVTEKGLPDTYKLYANEATYKQAAGPLESLQQISTIFLLIVIILGSVVLLFISLMTIRTRQREIGVLRTIGMKKSAISLGLIGETIAIVTVCLVLGLGVGNVVAQPIGHSMLENQIAAQKENESSGGQEDLVLTTGGLPVESEKVSTKDISVKLDEVALLQIIGLALIITVISAGIGVRYATRLEPMKILSEGN